MVRHHSQLQPRRSDGTFSGPPQSSGNGASRPVRSRGDGTLAAKMQAIANFLLDPSREHIGGHQFGRTRKVWRTLGYPAELEIAFREYLGKYRRSDIAGRIVDAPAKTTWRRGFEIRELDADGNPIEEEETDFVAAVRSLFKRTRFLSKAERLDRVAGIGQYAVMLIGSGKGDDLSEPLSNDNIQGPEDIVLFSIFREDQADIEEYGDDPTDERFELPTLYEIELSQGEGNRDARKEKVHWSRVIHFVDDPLEDDVFGRPRLERVFNRLEDIVKVAGGSAEMFWSNVGGLLHAAADKDVDLETEDMSEDEVLEAFADKILAAFHEQRRVVGTKGMSLEFLGAGTPDPSGIFSVLSKLLSAGAEMPASVIFGSERGDVANSYDLQKWHGDIEGRQERLAGPGIVEATLDRLISVDALEPPEFGYVVDWPPLRTQDAEQEASVLQSRAEAGKAIAEALIAGGDRAAAVLQTLIPELESVLQDDIEALGSFIEEEDRESLAELAELALIDGPDPLMRLAEESDSETLRTAADRLIRAAEVAQQSRDT